MGNRMMICCVKVAGCVAPRGMQLLMLANTTAAAVSAVRCCLVVCGMCACMNADRQHVTGILQDSATGVLAVAGVLVVYSNDGLEHV